MIAFIFVFLGVQAFAQTSYFLGKRTDTFPDSKYELQIAGILSIDKTSRTWSMIRCEANSADCISYKYRLYKDKDEKYYLEKPSTPGHFSSEPAKVEDDHINLRKFFISEKYSNGSSFQMEHLSLGQNTMWKVVSKNAKGAITEMKTMLEPASKEAYDNFVKGKKIEVLELKKLD